MLNIGYSIDRRFAAAIARSAGVRVCEMPLPGYWTPGNQGRTAISLGNDAGDDLGKDAKT